MAGGVPFGSFSTAPSDDELIQPLLPSGSGAPQNHLPHVLSLHNSTRPLNMLPNELFITILRLAANDEGLDQDGITWIIKTTGVCRLWRDVVVNTPLLWKEIELSRNLHFVELSLARSDFVSINIRLPMQFSDGRTQSQIDFSSIARLLVPRHQRISHMDLSIETDDLTPDSRRALSSLLEAPLSSLVSLCLTTSPSFRLTLRQGHLPSLRSLSLTSVTIDWTILRLLPYLTSLTLRNITNPDDGRAGSVVSLLDLLESCSSLESFTYESRKTASEVEIPAHRLVSLPQMRRFHLSGFPADILKVTPHLSLPRHAHLSLELFDLKTAEALDNQFPVFLAVLPRDTTYLPALRDVRHVMVWFEDAKVIVYADEQRTKFWDSRASKSSEYGLGPEGEEASVMPSLCMIYRLSGSESDEYVLENVVRELSTFFPSSVETLILRGFVNIVEPEIWARMLAAFPNIEHLELIAVECDMKSFPPALTPTPTTVPCSRLRTLVLRYEPNEKDGGRKMLEELCTVLRRRDEARCRLESLSIQVEPITDETLYTPSDVVNRLPAELAEIEQRLMSVVDSLEIMLLVNDD
ncbi:hypothetical protein DAEQUDRAFT_769583 [Daedalea quercina L-15889]|uniref:Uncharacterized protein n=1 Tax=Daedalea quercina L-15889 TaxID=1314783 RepID=A0A165LM18_9APHY|nr:hypothetical protein DAEQUDRAFT_769583 [Daedalea quercina L-15889]